MQATVSGDFDEALPACWKLGPRWGHDVNMDIGAAKGGSMRSGLAKPKAGGGSMRSWLAKPNMW